MIRTFGDRQALTYTTATSSLPEGRAWWWCERAEGHYHSNTTPVVFGFHPDLVWGIPLPRKQRSEYLGSTPS